MNKLAIFGRGFLQIGAFGATALSWRAQLRLTPRE